MNELAHEAAMTRHLMHLTKFRCPSRFVPILKCEHDIINDGYYFREIFVMGLVFVPYQATARWVVGVSASSFLWSCKSPGSKLAIRDIERPIARRLTALLLYIVMPTTE
jgi:hypothetical protein